MSTDRYLPLAGRLHRVEHSDAMPLVRGSLADLECVHGETVGCLPCAVATADAGRSVIARGHWPADYHDVPATLADFECVHLVIGECVDCELAELQAVCVHGRRRSLCSTCELESVVVEHGRHVLHAVIAAEAL